MNQLTIDLDKCFECGGPQEEMHHVIPRVRGGKRTIPLCSSCHGKVHGITGREGHSKLTKEGLAIARARGVKLGKPENLTKEASQKGADRKKREARLFNKEVSDIIVGMREKGSSFAEIARNVTEMGFITSTGGFWNGQTVSRLYKRVIAMCDN
tara:strand:+ start:842 stop:1303 length:462 start_codon:yes stop_codon:yes gene_type:complete